MPAGVASGFLSDVGGSAGFGSSFGLSVGRGFITAGGATGGAAAAGSDFSSAGLAVPGKLFVLYLPEGGDTAIISTEVPRPYRVFDPRNGKVLSEGRLPDTGPAQAKVGPASEPRVVVFTTDGGGI